MSAQQPRLQRRQKRMTPRTRQSPRERSSGEADFVVNPDDIFLNAESRSEFWRWKQKCLLLSPQDLFWPLDLSTEWRRHLIWSKKDNGKALLEVVTSRFASTLTFLSLLFSAEVGTYFSPSGIVTDIRQSLKEGPSSENQLQYCTGIVLMISIIITASAILANFSALLHFKSVDPENACVILRSDVGVYAAQLPSRLTVLSIYVFLSMIGKFE